MKMPKLRRIVLSLIVIDITMVALCRAQAPVGTGFSYQGRMKLTGNLITGKADFQFKLFDAASGGLQVGSTETIVADANPLAPNNVDKGLFNVVLDFVPNGADPDTVFNGEARWMEMAVRYPSNPSGGSLGFVTVSPRQELSAAPFAVRAMNSDRLSTYVDGEASIAIDPQPLDGSSLSFVDFFRDTVTTGPVRVRFFRGDGTQTIESQIALDNERTFFEIDGGNVGIGTGGPEGRLHVSGLPSQLILESTDVNQNAILEFRHPNIPSAPVTAIGLDRSSGGIYFNIADVTAMKVSKTGPFALVMIGTETPSTMLTVNGCITATNLACSSDARFKSHVGQVNDALQRVLKLEGVYFDWNCAAFPERNFSASRQLGFIAQDVLSILPEVVNEGLDGFLSVDYGRLTPVLVEAVEELHDIVVGQDAALAGQQRQIEELRSELDELKQLIAHHIREPRTQENAP